MKKLTLEEKGEFLRNACYISEGTSEEQIAADNIVKLLDRIDILEKEQADLLRVLNKAIHGGCIWKKGADIVEAENLIETIQKEKP